MKSELDIYLDDNYGKLYEKADNGIATIYNFQGKYGVIKHQFIKRKIPEKLYAEEELFDAITPYGYGGPVILEVEDGKKEELVEEFSAAFTEYCKQEKIVSEFVRFHPIVENALDFQKVYQPVWDRNTVGTDLERYDDPVQCEFSKRCRKNIRQAVNKGVSYRITYQPDDLSSFQKVYYSTMDRNDASDYYYFDDSYFEKMLKYFKEKLLLIEAIYEEKVIAAGIYFLSNKTMHVHLSGTLKEYLYLSPAYVLRYALAIWGKENGYKLIHHGGGRSNSEEDALYSFKKQFGVNTKLDFYVGRKVWLPDKYSMICRKNGVNEDTAFFPAYRAKG